MVNVHNGHIWHDINPQRMESSGMIHHVALVRTDILTRAMWRNIPEDAILYSHRRENLKSYMT
jgi:hypothetical protein